MAKPASTPVEASRLRLVPHVANGKVVPEKWDCVEETVRGEVVGVRKLETCVNLAVARSRWRGEMTKRVEVEAEKVHA